MRMRYKVYTEHDNVSVPSESGSSEYNVYERFVDEETGEVSLRKVGVRNRYEEIQEAAVGTTLPELIEKYQKGEISDFNFRQGQYLDMTQFPSNAIEVLNLLKSSEHLDVLNNYLRSLNGENKEEGLDVKENNLEEKEDEKNEKE